MKNFALISNRGPDFTSGNKQHAAVGGTKDAYAHLMDEFCDSWTCIAPDEYEKDEINSRYGEQLNVVLVEREKYRNYYNKFVSEGLYPLLVGWPEKTKSLEYHQDFLDVSKQVAESVEKNAPGHDVLICDYHLYKVPELMNGNSRSVFFWYIPFHRNYPDTPLVRDIVTSLGRCDDLVFLHQKYAENFMQMHDKITNGSKLQAKVHGIALGPHENFGETENISRENFNDVLRNRFGIEPNADKKYMISVARMDFVKNIPLLLNAFKRFIATPEGESIDLLLVLPPHRPGSELYDEEEKLIRSIIEDIPADRISVYWKSLPREEIIALYKYSDIFTAPSRHDGMPLTPFEYALANEGSGDIVLSDGIGAHELLRPFSQDFQRDNETSLVASLTNAMRATDQDKRRRMEQMKRISEGITLHQWLTKVAAMLVTRYPKNND